MPQERRGAIELQDIADGGQRELDANRAQNARERCPRGRLPGHYGRNPQNGCGQGVGGQSTEAGTQRQEITTGSQSQEEAQLSGPMLTVHDAVMKVMSLP